MLFTTLLDQFKAGEIPHESTGMQALYRARVTCYAFATPAIACENLCRLIANVTHTEIITVFGEHDLIPRICLPSINVRPCSAGVLKLETPVCSLYVCAGAAPRPAASGRG